MALTQEQLPETIKEIPAWEQDLQKRLCAVFCERNGIE
jgi:hypothetical protein